MEWTRVTPETLPLENTHVLVSDGETITQAYYVLSEKHINWFMCPSYNGLAIDWWTALPLLPPKIVRDIVNGVDNN